ncbi:MAG: ribonuclease HII [Acholeplasmataceae bacterium]|jgi:ribonuclease HII|nr:ribonuclease HII [Acholeplasmataceae bacterium]
MDLYQIEQNLHEQGYLHILGTDEAGRGPMAGPLVAAAVILPENYHLDGLNDSKKTSPKMREKLYDIIKKEAIEVTVEIVPVEVVDRINVYQASKQAMLSCIEKMQSRIDYVLTDAMKLNIDIPCLDIIKGDQKAAAIAAASIIAKVTRDRLMVELDRIYPQYGFKKHKGYVTKYHLEMLAKYGPSPVHRQSFEPVHRITLEQMKLDLDD